MLSLSDLRTQFSTGQGQVNAVDGVSLDIGDGETVGLVRLVGFGCGLLGCAGSAIAGPSLEAMHAHVDTASGWSEVDSRRVMARIGGFGASVMIAARVAGMALGYR